MPRLAERHPAKEAKRAVIKPEFLVERDGPTALLTFNRPDARNSMTFEMY